MNFQKLQSVENYEFYLDFAFRNAKKRMQIIQQEKIRNKTPTIILNFNKYVEIERIKEATKNLCTMLNSIHTKFPHLDDLPAFYCELAKITINYDETKKALAAIKWAVFQIKNQRANAIPEIKKAISHARIAVVRKQFYGRVSSIIKQIQSSFLQLEETRKIMKSWPDIKIGIRTIAIAGYPNVGKSSILKALTGTKPEIKEYAFTTKRLNVGYFEIEPRRYQVIDTPGTFDRDIKKMNRIEKQAFLVLKLLAEKIIYVFDPSESCGYNVNDQLQLLKRLDSMFSKPKIIIVNKTDLNHIEKNIALIKKTSPHILRTSVNNEAAIDELKKMVNT